MSFGRFFPFNLRPADYAEVFVATFDRKSRYVKPALVPYEAVDIRGRTVAALPVPDPPVQRPIGRHVRRDGQNLDQLANGYLNDANAYWRICEVNDAILPDALAEVEEIDIPDPAR